MAMEHTITTLIVGHRVDRTWRWNTPLQHSYRDTGITKNTQTLALTQHVGIWTQREAGKWLDGVIATTIHMNDCRWKLCVTEYVYINAFPVVIA